MADKIWWVYLVRCSDGTLYTGATTDVERRVREHNGSKRGARYTSKRRPVALVFSQAVGTVSQALRRERQIKSLTRKEKERLIIL